MLPSCQVKLLRVPQGGVFRPIGRHSEISVDVRVIAATKRDLAGEMALGHFREDLYYQHAVLMINTPAPIRVQDFLEPARKTLRRSQKRKVEDRAMAMSSTYGWPGNVRQLRLVGERLVGTTSRRASITADDIHGALPGVTLTATAQAQVIYDENDSLDQFLDRTMLQLYQQLLAKTGSHTKTARMLRTDRVSFISELNVLAGGSSWSNSGARQRAFSLPHRLCNETERIYEFKGKCFVAVTGSAIIFGSCSR
jgi:DNA-binding NtrC family response regulator